MSNPNSGSVAFATPHRGEAAAAIAGILAEHGVQRLTIADPRICRVREIVARESDLPGQILNAVPGTTITADGLALLIDDRHIQWVAAADLAVSLRAMSLPA
jgi:hypothetical protein